MASAGFDEAYDRVVQGRDFVEYRDYYAQARSRYRQTADLIGRLGLPRGARHLDIGGGQMALLTREMHGFRPTVGDVVATSEQDIAGQGVAFHRLNLMDDSYDASRTFDLITLCEVIEHIPVPPYITFRKLAPLIAPGGWLVLTTPNGFRIRNVLRMLANREVLDIYRYPEGDEGLGHQHEYTVRQMDWQLRKAGFEPHTLTTYVSGWKGASAGARLAHLATAPFNLFPHLRDGILVAARAPTPVQT